MEELLQYLAEERFEDEFGQEPPYYVEVRPTVEDNKIALRTLSFLNQSIQMERAAALAVSEGRADFEQHKKSLLYAAQKGSKTEPTCHLEHWVAMAAFRQVDTVLKELIEKMEKK